MMIIIVIIVVTIFILINNNFTNTNSNNKKYVCLGADVRQMDFDSSLRLFQQRDAARSDDLLL